ncbi:hypothetical protein QEN19_003190 [Hanseniaspora menglaensis]
MSLPEIFQNNFLPQEIQFLVENELIKIVPSMNGKTSNSKKQIINSKEKRRQKLLDIRNKQFEQRKREIYSDDEDDPYQTRESMQTIDQETNYLYEKKESGGKDDPEEQVLDWNFITTDQDVLRNLKSSIPIEIPLWVAMILKKQRFCRLVTPSWLSVARLKEYLIFEKKTPYKFSALPWSWMVISKMFINQFADDLPKEDSVTELRSILQDIREIRMAKVQRGMEILNESHLQLDNLSLLEINEFRPFILTTMTKMKNLHKSSLTQEDLKERPQEIEIAEHADDDLVPMDLEDYEAY